jgi:hypothetical protein
MVTFAQFWSRLKSEFSHAPSPRPGVHVVSVKKWSQFSGEMSGRFSVIYQGGNVLHGDTAGTNNWRNISEAEFRKVYEVWQTIARAGKTGSSSCTTSGLRTDVGHLHLVPPRALHELCGSPLHSAVLPP